MPDLGKAEREKHIPQGIEDSNAVPTEGMTVAFIGNPNCGKTTLFNAYTGANLKVANWSRKSRRGYRQPRCTYSPRRSAGDVQPDVVYDGRTGFPQFYPQ